MTLPHPAAMQELWGHEQAEQTLLSLALSGRMPHAWVFTGPKGVGKATLAFRFARFLLYRGVHSGSSHNHLDLLIETHSKNLTPANLSIPVEAPAAAQVAAGSHPDLLVIEPAEAGKDINVEQIRAVPPFLSMTASQGGWRIVIVDGAESMNRAAQNALLKVLEEPSPNSVLILVAENIGALLPTIRSRVRLLRLQAQDNQPIERIAKFDPRVSELTQNSQQTLWRMAGGAPGQALQLLDQEALTTLDHLANYIRSPSAELADDLARGFAYQPQFAIAGRVLLWLLHQLATGNRMEFPQPHLPRLLKFYEESQTTLAETDGLNLDGNACWHALLTRLPTIFER